MGVFSFSRSSTRTLTSSQIELGQKNVNMAVESKPDYSSWKSNSVLARRASTVNWGALCWRLTLVLLFLGFQVAMGFWIYFYVHTNIHQNPRIYINSTGPRWNAYLAFMYIFGIVNSVLWGAGFIAGMCGIDDTRRLSGGAKCLINTIIFPIGLFFVIFATFGGLIVETPAQSYEWNHGCDSSVLSIVLDGVAAGDPSWVPQEAHFILNPHDFPLFTYDIWQTGADTWTFDFREFDSDPQTIQMGLMPVIQHIEYDFVNNTLVGLCGSANDTCLTGTFDIGDFLAFSLTYNGTTTNLRVHDQYWSFSDSPPSFILQGVDPETNDLGATVMATNVAMKSDCTQMKICADGPPGGGLAGAVGPLTLAPMGLVLMSQADYANECTASD